MSSFEAPGIVPVATLNAVSSDAFAMLGISLVAGRHFTEMDSASLFEGGAVIINQVLAQRLWQEENPIGKVFYGMNLGPYEVVGVVRNYHQIPGNRDFVPAIYFPGTVMSIRPDFLVKLHPGTSFQNFHSNIRKRLSGFTLDGIEVRPLSDLVKDATANQRLAIQLLFCFAILGIVVSGLAVYATAMLAAAARTRETGIRMALGAQTWDILRLAFWRGFRAILFGLPFGLFLAWILSRIISNYLVQVNVDDALMWVIGCAIPLVIATVASLIPALRATRVNPSDALRDK
jgi:ABC-type antimicrobial peptide transport system permease subunit